MRTSRMGSTLVVCSSNGVITAYAVEAYTSSKRRCGVPLGGFIAALQSTMHEPGSVAGGMRCSLKGLSLPTSVLAFLERS